jgi:predicted metalloprotease
MRKNYYMDEEITKEMILAGLENGLIHIINNQNDNCISAQIGDYWFYFTGQEDEELTVKEYLVNYDNDTIAGLIYRVINHEPINGETEDEAAEWMYYRDILI